MNARERREARTEAQRLADRAEGWSSEGVGPEAREAIQALAEAVRILVKVSENQERFF